MKVLVTGGNGQLGHDVASVLQASGVQVIAPPLLELDFTAPASIDAVIAKHRPDWVINCAAYTQVDKAESEADTAFAVNRDAPGQLARAVAGTGGRLLQVSTDFVFDGKASEPYAESSPAQPLSVYGRSKLAGEQAVMEALPNAIILRTAWLYGVNGHNFVKTMLRLAIAGKPLRVVDDQVGSPTWTMDLAKAIAVLLDTNACGLFHYTNAGQISWHGFASAILAEAAGAGFEIKTREVEPIPTSNYPTPAERPAYSVLDTGRISALPGIQRPAWRDSLKKMLEELHTCEDCL